MYRRPATYVATLVYADEPQVIWLQSGSATLIAVAIPHENRRRSQFLATTTLPNDWSSYVEGNVDLRYLFTFPSRRLTYVFDLATMKNQKVFMDRREEAPPEEW